jgi:hypothetical protein
VNANAVGTMPEVDLLALARSVERSVPADLDEASRGLQLLSRGVGSQLEEERGFGPASQSGRRHDAERLQALIARITKDLVSCVKNSSRY